VFLVCGALVVTDCWAEPARHFDIAPDLATSSLVAFASQSDWSVMFINAEEWAGVKTHELRTDLEPEQALLRLLKGTGLGCQFLRPGKVLVDWIARTRNGPKHCAPARSHAPPSPGVSSNMIVKLEMGPELGRDPAERVVVTGTHLHGNSETGSREIIVTDTDPLWTGTNTVADIIRRLPQDFRGGPSEDTRWIGAETLSNTGLGVGADLRGLGARATLVMVDGRRMAPSGNAAAFVDLLNVPLSALERIEIVMDGASALYGSDAVGGVINLITRKHFHGALMFADLGSGTGGTQHQARLGQILGRDWDSGGVVVTLEDYHRDGLSSAQRGQATSDLNPWGPNLGSPYSNPGTLLTKLGSFVIPARQNVLPLNFQTLQAGQNPSDVYANADVLPSQRRLSLFISAHQTLIDNIEGFAQLLWTQRNATQRQGGERTVIAIPNNGQFFTNVPSMAGPLRLQYDLDDVLGPEDFRVKVRTFNLATGLDARLPFGWHASTSVADVLEQQSQYTLGEANPVALANALVANTPALAFNPLSGVSPSSTAVAAIKAQPWFGMLSEMWQFHAAADGPLAHLPGGDLRLAVGTEYRNQFLRTGLSQGMGSTVTSEDLGRRLYAAYGELMIPVVGAANSTIGLRKLDLSLAARYEDYSDFGSTLTPRFWLLYAPFDGVEIRASYARSTRAPNLGDLDQHQNVSLFTTLPDPSAPGGNARVLAWSGGDANLTAERASSRTAGIHFAPTGNADFQAEIDYFNTVFADRIQTTGFTGSQIDPTLLIDSQYQDIVTRSPTLAQRQPVCLNTLFAGTAQQCLTTPVTAIVDLRSLNIATVFTQGIDFSTSSSITTSFGDLHAELSGTYLLDFSQKQTPHAPVQRLLNTPNNPINLQLVGSVGWCWHGFDAQLTGYYSNGYHDPVSQPARSIPSWTTVDAGLQYTFGEDRAHGSKGVMLGLNVQNVFNRYPPSVVNRAAQIGYDQENGDLNGRVVHLTISKHW
jgi:iron complex outermembrane recepter protein